MVTSCARKTYDKLFPVLSDGKYDTEFPYRDCSQQLNNISRSVFKIYCMAEYKSFVLNPHDRLLPGDISMDNLFLSTEHTVKSTKANTGTGLLIYYDNTHIALLTCAHILNFPDTLYTYYNDNDPYTPDYLQGIAVKSRQMNFIRGYPEGSDLEILAMDQEKDLAIIGKTLERSQSDLVVFPYPLGHSEELEWGSFAYILGYPMGYQMITRGIVSRPEHLSDEAFLIDANFNEGFSGGIVLSIKDGIPNFEMVGMGKSASATYENVLVPYDPHNSIIFNPDIPYEGDAYVSRKTNLNYGVTFAIATTAIREFYEQNRKSLNGKGFFLDDFFN
jgi:hypothetical protein